MVLCCCGKAKGDDWGLRFYLSKKIQKGLIQLKKNLKRSLIKNAIMVVSSLALVFTFSIDTFAYNLLPYSLSGGVGDWGYTKRYYWVDSSASSINTTINNAYSSWINTTNILSTPISWRQTTTKADGTVEFYGYRASDGANGYTNFWKYSNQVSPKNENWGWCKVYYNYYYSGGQATIAHEIGHTMGLNENNGNKYSIMCQAGSGRKVTTPQYDDLAGINAKY